MFGRGNAIDNRKLGHNHLVSYPRGGHLSAFTPGKAPTGLACVLFPCLFPLPGFSHLNKRITQQCGPPKARSARSETEETDSIFPPFWHWLLFPFSAFPSTLGIKRLSFGDTPSCTASDTIVRYTHSLPSLFLGFRFPVSRMMDDDPFHDRTRTSHDTRTLATIDDHQRRLTTTLHRLDAERPTFSSSTTGSIRENHSTWSDTADFATWTGIQ